LKSRWYSFAIKAKASGALDYSRISRNDDKSLILEALVFEELSRQADLDDCRFLSSLMPSTASGEARADLLDIWNKLSKPWQKPEARIGAKPPPATPLDADTIKNMVAIYENFKNSPNPTEAKVSL
jgi:hypothetical protein